MTPGTPVGSMVVAGGRVGWLFGILTLVQSTAPAAAELFTTVPLTSKQTVKTSIS